MLAEQKSSVKNKHDREQHILRDHIPDYFLFHQVGCTLLSEAPLSTHWQLFGGQSSIVPHPSVGSDSSPSITPENHVIPQKSSTSQRIENISRNKAPVPHCHQNS